MIAKNAILYKFNGIINVFQMLEYAIRRLSEIPETAIPAIVILRLRYGILQSLRAFRMTSEAVA